MTIPYLVSQVGVFFEGQEWVVVKHQGPAVCQVHVEPWPANVARLLVLTVLQDQLHLQAYKRQQKTRNHYYTW